MNVNGKTVSLQRGWNRLSDNLGCHHVPGTGTRFVAHYGQYVTIDGRSGYMPPRGILTIRPSSPPPTLGVLRPWGQPEDYRGPGGFEISPCGDGTLLDHDAIMQRCPVALRDMATGQVRHDVPVAGYYALSRGWSKVTTLPEYVMPASLSQYDDGRIPHDVPGQGDPAVRERVLAYLPYDGQHLIRAFRCAIGRRDPLVRLDLEDLCADAELAWTDAVEADICSGQQGHGNGGVGREWAWVAYLSVLATNIGLVDRMRQIAEWVQTPIGLMQRLEHGSFYGSPDPWGAPEAGGSGVPISTAVAQDIEAHMQVVALCKLGMVGEAARLFRCVALAPKRKWISCDSGDGVGTHGADFFDPWFSIGALAAQERDLCVQAARAWRIPTKLGSSVGPFFELGAISGALIAWGDLGKSRWAIQRLT